MSEPTKYMRVSSENPQVIEQNKDETVAYIVANHDGITQEQATAIVSDIKLWMDGRLASILNDPLNISSHTLNGKSAMNDQGMEKILDAIVGFWKENN